MGALAGLVFECITCAVKVFRLSMEVPVEPTIDLGWTLVVLNPRDRQTYPALAGNNPTESN